MGTKFMFLQQITVFSVCGVGFSVEKKLFLKKSW